VRTQPSSVEYWGAFFGGAGGPYAPQTSPFKVTLPGTVAEVGSSNSTEYALLTNGTLYAWGLGDKGELGNGSLQNSLTKPVRVRFPRGVRIWSIPTDAMPYDTGLAIDTTGRAWGWGDNFGGELCLGNTKVHATPVELRFAHVTLVAGANNHALYDSNGNVYACGWNAAGDLGTGSWHSAMKPARVVGLDGSKVTRLVASFANSGALLSNGQYYDWGYDGAGQLGDGRINKKADVPVRVKLPYRVTQIAQGGSIWSNGQTLAMLSNGSLWGWGNNRACQLGSVAPKAVPTPVRVLQHPGFVALATGSATAYGISKANGAVYAWGANHLGQVGYGTAQTVCTPVQVVPSGATEISSTANNVVVSTPGPVPPLGG
jgi:alpha-tubulin suppressor-like RCC1 family protein